MKKMFGCQRSFVYWDDERNTWSYYVFTSSDVCYNHQKYFWNMMKRMFLLMKVWLDEGDHLKQRQNFELLNLNSLYTQCSVEEPTNIFCILVGLNVTFYLDGIFFGFFSESIIPLLIEYRKNQKLRLNLQQAYELLLKDTTWVFGKCGQFYVMKCEVTIIIIIIINKFILKFIQLTKKYFGILWLKEWFIL